YIIPVATLSTPGWPGLRVRLAQANRHYIVAGQNAPTEQIVMAVRDGAHDFLQLEDGDKRWESAITRIVETQQFWLQLYGGIERLGTELLMGESPSIRSLRQQIERLGPTNASVLISGES